jgi:hypothetical protein
VPPHATSRFKHALIQDAAYQSLLRSTRQQYHQRTAQVVEARFPEICETQPELLAHHYTGAGVPVQAIPYWQRAGQRALERWASLEAIEHLTRGLDVLKILPNTPMRVQQELDLQTTISPALMMVKGYAAPEVLHAYARARAFCQQVGETPQLPGAARIMDLLSANYLGEFAAAHFAQGTALYKPQQHHAHALRYGEDPRVVCRAYAGVTLWWLGYPDQALQRSHEALTLAQQLAHPYSLEYALFFATWRHQFRRQWHLTHERAEALIALAAEQGFALWKGGDGHARVGARPAGS